MLKIGAYEAKTRFSELIKKVAQGEQVIITKNGIPVAIIKPVSSTTREDVKRAISMIREIRRGQRLKDIKIRELIEEGRQ